jgi:hypothetical protein
MAGPIMVFTWLTACDANIATGQWVERWVERVVSGAV